MCSYSHVEILEHLRALEGDKCVRGWELMIIEGLGIQLSRKKMTLYVLCRMAGLLTNKDQSNNSK